MIRSFLKQHSFGIRILYVCIGAILLLLPGCGSQLPTTDDSPPIRITRTMMDTIPQTDTVYVGWSLGYTFTPVTDKTWPADNHLLYSVDDPTIASVTLGLVDDSPVYSWSTGQVIGWQYPQPIRIDLVKAGKFTLTVWPWSDTRLKKRITFVVLPIGNSGRKVA